MCINESIFRQQSQNDAESLWIPLKQRQKLLWSSLTVAMAVCSKQRRHPLWQLPSHAQNFISFSIRLKWSFGISSLLSISLTFNCSPVNTSSWMLKLVKTFFKGCHWRKKVTIFSIQGVFLFRCAISLPRKNGVTDRCCSIFIFLIFGDTFASTWGQTKPADTIRVKDRQKPSTRMYYRIISVPCNRVANGGWA